MSNDDVHSNTEGAATIQKLWAEKMESLYAAPTSEVFVAADDPQINYYGRFDFSDQSWRRNGTDRSKSRRMGKML